MSDRVHFHMSAPDSEGPVYKLLDPSSALFSTFDAWVQEEINIGLGMFCIRFGIILLRRKFHRST